FTMDQLGHLTCQGALAFAGSCVGCMGFADAVNLVERQEGKVLQKRFNVGVCQVHPKLVEAVGRGFAGIKPYGIAFGFTELGAVCLGDRRQGKAEYAALVHTSGKVNTAGNVAPLVAAAYLYGAVMRLVQLRKVERLQ